MRRSTLPVLVAGLFIVPAIGPPTASAGGAPPSAVGPNDLVGLPAWDLARTATLDTAALSGVAVAGSDTWAVGTTVSSSLTERWNGMRFVRVASPNVSGRVNVLEDVAGTSEDDVWAVGHADASSGLSSDTLIEHWDGSEWEIVPSPTVPDYENTLTGVTALSPTDAWAVGTRTNVQPGATAILLHWDGTRWRNVKSGCGSYLTEIDARSESDIWVIGGSGSCHFNGKRWVSVPLAPPNNPEHGLDMLDVTVIGASDVWAVGDEISECGEGVCQQGAVEHWDGKKWTYVNVDEGLPILYGVDSNATDDVYAVGLGYRAAIVHFDGAEWKQIPNPDVLGSLRSVALDAGNAWAVGESPGSRPHPVAERAPSPTSGAVVGGTKVSHATISWFGKESGSVETDIFGYYQVGGLTAGRYRFTAQYTGCQPASVKVQVPAGETIQQDLSLRC
jgi:carboxypeptidase family protein